jgi:hypothetical protein
LPALEFLLCDKVSLLDQPLGLRMFRPPMYDLDALLMKQSFENAFELTSVVTLDYLGDTK